MGILDDAIREHLDLKRRHGAGESELQQLEDEAFGLPTRPGEPDFPEPSDDDGDRAAPAAEAPVTEHPVEPEPTAMEHPVVEAEAEPEDVEIPTAEAEEAVEVAPVEPPPQEAPADEAEAPATAEPEPTAIFDRSEGEELGLDDLDLDLADEIDEGLDEIGTEDEPPAAEAVELDTVEHEPESEPEEEAGPPAAADEPVEEGEPASEEEDVLEETPEFLQDRPEDDELWFEQGKPKDFDF